MKLNQITALLLVAIMMMAGSQHVHAQPLSSENLREVNVDNISDEEIKAGTDAQLNAALAKLKQ